MLLVARPASQQPGRKRGIEGSKQFIYHGGSCIGDLNGSLQVKATRIFRWLVYYPQLYIYMASSHVDGESRKAAKMQVPQTEGQSSSAHGISEEEVEKQQHHGE